jgi:hypothetical protein
MKMLIDIPEIRESEYRKFVSYFRKEFSDEKTKRLCLLTALDNITEVYSDDGTRILTATEVSKILFEIMRNK